LQAQNKRRPTRIKTQEDEDKNWEDSYPYSLLGYNLVRQDAETSAEGRILRTEIVFTAETIARGRSTAMFDYGAEVAEFGKKVWSRFAFENDAANLLDAYPKGRDNPNSNRPSHGKSRGFYRESLCLVQRMYC